jgi:putative copper export protein
VDLTLIALWIHVPLVTAWIGLVMLDVYAAAVPGLTLSQRGRMLAWSRPFVVAAIVLILLTGIRQTMQNPFQEVDSWSTLQALKDRTYGLMLFYKHICVLITFVLTVIVRFVLAPRLLRAAVPAGGAGGAAAGNGTLQLVRWLSVVNALACLATLVFATRMVWELH